MNICLAPLWTENYAKQWRYEDENCFCPHRIYIHKENHLGLTENYYAVMTLIKACTNCNKNRRGSKGFLGEL